MITNAQNHNESKNDLERTIAFWEPRYGHSLSLDDAEEIRSNMVSLFKLLHDLDRKYFPNGQQLSPKPSVTCKN